MMNSLFTHFDKIVVVDIETTGFNSKTDEIIEIAGVQVSSDAETYRVEHELNTLVSLSEGRKLSHEITGLTGISDQMLMQYGKPKLDVCKQIVEIFDNPKTLLVAYNAQFDLCFLYYFLMKFDSAKVLKQVKMLDAMTIYKDRRDYPHKLSDAVSAYKLEHKNAHRAIDDAKTTLNLLVAMGKENDDLERYINLFGYNPKYGVSGTRISSIKYMPQGYNRCGRLYEM